MEVYIVIALSLWLLPAFNVEEFHFITGIHLFAIDNKKV